jgi:hypothetical protein
MRAIKPKIRSLASRSRRNHQQRLRKQIKTCHPKTNLHFRSKKAGLRLPSRKLKPADLIRRPLSASISPDRRIEDKTIRIGRFQTTEVRRMVDTRTIDDPNAQDLRRTSGRSRNLPKLDQSCHQSLQSPSQYTTENRVTNQSLGPGHTAKSSKQSTFTLATKLRSSAFVLREKGTDFPSPQLERYVSCSIYDTNMSWSSKKSWWRRMSASWCSNICRTT